jgi:hypothetical protein
MKTSSDRSTSRRRFQRLVLLGLSTLVVMSLLPMSVFAYEGDHYTWTYYLALHVGFTKRQAYQIADATYAIDWDKDTGPMEATPGDAIFGADHTGFVGTRHPQIAHIWSRFHAFKKELGDFTGPGDQMNIRATNLKELWGLALSERNPGPYIHLLQDTFAHGDYDTTRGHAAAGHKPDFLSYDQEKAKEMTRETIRALTDFMVVLGGKPKAPDMDRIYQVLGMLFEVNAIPNAPNVGIGIVEELCKKFPALCPLDPKASSAVAPSLLRSLAVINHAIEDDERYGRLPRWPTELGASALLPSKWYQFDYDPEGKVADKSRYSVEKLKVELLKETIKIDKVDDANVRVNIRLPYKISRMLKLIDGNGNVFLAPLPVIETHVLSDAKYYPKIINEERENGEFVTEFTFERPRSDLRAGKLTWECEIRVYGLDPEKRSRVLSLDERTEAAPCANPDSIGGVIQSLPFFGQSDVAKANRPLTSPLKMGYSVEDASGAVGFSGPAKITFGAGWSIGCAAFGQQPTGRYERSACDDYQRSGTVATGVLGENSCVGSSGTRGTQDPNFYADPYMGNARAVVLTADASITVDVGVAIYPAASHGARDKPDVIAACKKAAEDWVKVIASRLMGSTGIPRGVGPPIIAAMLPDIVRTPESGNGQLQGYFDQAKSSLQRHDLNGALSQFEQAYKAAPDSAALNYNLSWMYQAQERPLTAVKHAENYLRLAPDASDRADVEARIADMREELRTNPRAQYDPNSCREIYNWAQVEKEAAKRDVARRQAILEILIASQRGDCETARKLQQNYKQGNR